MAARKKRKHQEATTSEEEWSSEGEEKELGNREVHVVVFGSEDGDWHCDAAESAMLLKSVLAPTHSKTPFTVALVARGNEGRLEGRAWFTSGGAAARAQSLSGAGLRAGSSRATVRVETTTLEAVTKALYTHAADSSLHDLTYCSGATTLRDREASCARRARRDRKTSPRQHAKLSGSSGVTADHKAAQYWVKLDDETGLAAGEAGDDEAVGCAQVLWWLVKRKVEADVGKRWAKGFRGRLTASAASLRAHNASQPAANSGVWDAPAPPKLDAKAEKWTLAQGGNSGTSPPTLVAEAPADARCAWTTTRTVPKSVFAGLHKRRVAERSPRVEHVLERVVDPSGAQWTLSLDARRPEQHAKKDKASDVGVYARCDFAGPDGARPFGACCEARFAFCVAEHSPGGASSRSSSSTTSTPSAAASRGGRHKAVSANLRGCGGSRAASWLFRARELYDDQTVPHLPARGFARLVVGLEADSPDPDPACLWFANFAENNDDDDDDDDERGSPSAAESSGADFRSKDHSEGDKADPRQHGAESVSVPEGEPCLVVCASVLSLRRAKGVDTWRLVRRCCAEGASGYSTATLRPQNLWAFLCRAVRSGDVECVKAIARQIQAENGGDTGTGLLRQIERDERGASDPNNGYSALHWLGNCDDANFAKAPAFAPKYGEIVTWFRSVCGADVFDAEIDGGVDSRGSRKAATTPLGFVAGSTSDKTRQSSKLAVAALLKAGADPTLPASRESTGAVGDDPHHGAVAAERGAYAVARALYADNADVAREILAALFGLGTYARRPAVDRRAAFAVVADAVDVLLSKADELVVAEGLECLLSFSHDARDAALHALKKRHADAVGRDADRSPVHELVACALRMDSNPSAKQRKRGPDALRVCIDRTLALAAKLVKEERLTLRHARGGERVRLYLEAFTRRQAKLLAPQQHPQPTDRAAVDSDRGADLEDDLSEVASDFSGARSKAKKGGRKKKPKSKPRKAKNKKNGATQDKSLNHDDDLEDDDDDDAAATGPDDDHHEDNKPNDDPAAEVADAGGGGDDEKAVVHARGDDDDARQGNDDPDDDDGDDGDIHPERRVPPEPKPRDDAPSAPEAAPVERTEALRAGDPGGDDANSAAGLEAPAGDLDPSHKAAARLRKLVEDPAQLTSDNVDELERCRALTRGLEGSARDRAAAKRLIRKHRTAERSASPEAERAAADGDGDPASAARADRAKKGDTDSSAEGETNFMPPGNAPPPSSPPEDAPPPDGEPQRRRAARVDSTNSGTAANNSSILPKDPSLIAVYWSWPRVWL